MAKHIYEYDLVFGKYHCPALKRKEVAKFQPYNDCHQTPKQIAELIEECYGASKLVEEHVWIACFNIHYSLIGIFDVSHGDIKGAMLNMGGIMQRALLSGAVGIVMIHNHPGGGHTFSHEDKIAAQRLYNAAKLLDIELLDSIIISEYGHHMIFNSLYNIHDVWKEIENGQLVEAQNS